MKRIQRKRTKGWKMPENTVYVGRPSKWGNPFKLVGNKIYYKSKIPGRWEFFTLGDIDDVIYYYRKLWDGTKFKNPVLQRLADEFSKLDLNELKGKDLACFCQPGQPCHADVLIELCNK